MAVGLTHAPLELLFNRIGVYISMTHITPALLGGPNEQMVSYYVAYFINVTLNWGMACALGALLFGATLLLYGVYRRFTNHAVSL
jgi:putative spermidine/putrescine transport system permease protein